MTVTDTAELDEPKLPDARKAPPFVSYSSLTLHRKCPQAWTYKHLRGLSALEGETLIDRDLGSWWHMLRAMDSIRRGQRHDSLLSAPAQLTSTDDGPTLSTEDPNPNRVVQAFDGWFRRLPSEIKDAWLERLGDPTRHLVGMHRRWRARWGDDIEAEHPVAVELKIRRELPGTGGITLGGYVDEIYADRKRGLLVLRDHKTMKTIPVTDTGEDVMDSQLHLYAWACQPQVQSLTGGRGVNAISYDRVRSAVPKQPQLTQMGNLSKSVTDFDLDTYQAWVKGPDGGGIPFDGRKKDGSQAGIYTAEEKLVEKLSTPVARAIWADRTLTPLNRNVIRAHLQAAIDSARDTQKTSFRVQRSGDAQRNLDRYGCSRCDFLKLCRAELIGGPEGSYDPEEFGLQVRPQGGRSPRKSGHQPA